MTRLLAVLVTLALLAPSPGACAAVAAAARPLAPAVPVVSFPLQAPRLDAPALTGGLAVPTLAVPAPHLTVKVLYDAPLPKAVLAAVANDVRPEAAPAQPVLPAAAVAGEAAPEAFAAAAPETRAALKTRFAELRAAFGMKAAVDLPDAGGGIPASHLAPAKAAETKGRAAPAAPKAPRRILGFGPALAFFLGALAVEEIGNETSAAGLPPLIAKVFGDVTISAEMGIWSALADVAGSLITPALAKRLGLKAAYLWSAGARLLAGAATAGLLASGHMTVPLLMAVSVFGAFAGGVNYTTEKAIPAVLLNQDQAQLERFKAARQGVIEVMATVVPIGTGALVAGLGFLPALVAFPVAAGASMLLVALTLGIPQRAAALKSAMTPAGDGGFLRSVTRGARVTLKTPALRWSFLAYAFYYLMNPLLYWLIAPAYGVFMAGAGHEEKAALIQGVMLGLFSLGGLVASVMVMREHKRMEHAGEAERKARLRASLLRWMRWGAAALVLLAALALPGPAWHGLTLAALALLPFGLAHVTAKLKIESFFQSSAPADAVDDATAFMEGGVSLLIMAALWGGRLLFTTFAGLTPFLVFAALMAPLGAVFLWLTARLAKFA